jgi:BirA family transcriptional regulator, biotin operon repressor / biotin---[acetyl-CoA-carboxylase] ligase
LPQPPATKPIGSPFVELQSVDSTNNYALAQAHAGLAQHGMAIFAHEQLSGKGQRGKIWITEKDTSLIMSTVIKPVSLLPAQQFWLNAFVAVAVHKFFMHYAGPETKIKWPNDLYWQDRKAGGILIENIIGTDEPEFTNKEKRITQWKWAIIGTGININQAAFSTKLQNPVSLKQITGRDFDVIVLAKELCRVLNTYFEQLISEGFENIYSQYLTHLYKKNEMVKLKKGNRIFEATIKSVSPAGKLIVQHAIEEEFDFGEVEWVM